MILQISKIHLRRDRPALDLEHVAELKKSIAKIGLINPITVDVGHTLIAGAHRLEACKQLGWTEIEATELDLDMLGSRLARIDENLVRRVGTALERAELLRERKEIYERMHPVAAKPGPKGDSETVSSFAADTAKKTGTSARSVQQYAQAATITPEAKAVIAETPAADSITDLVELARQPAADQVKVARQVKKSGGTVKRAIKDRKRAAQDRAIAKYVAPAGRFAVILDDPSWKYEQTLKAMDRDLPYPPETMEKIKADVPPADDNCTLYLCTTNAHLREAFEVGDAWGFRYTGACITWGKVDKKGKPRKGMGFWVRGCTEHVLIFVRGKPVHRGAKGDSLLLAERGANSEKPDELYALIEQLSPAKSRLERHARKARDGWVTSGAELPEASAKRDDFLVQQSGGRFYVTHAGVAALSPAGFKLRHGAEIFRAGGMAERLIAAATCGAGRVPKKLIRIVEAAQSSGQRGLTKRSKTA